jgi:hypothetical protein
MMILSMSCRPLTTLFVLSVFCALAGGARAGEAPKLTVWPAKLVVGEGQGQRVLVSRVDTDGFEQDVTAQASFAVDGGAAVVEGGRVRGVKTGTTTISVKFLSASATIPVRITPAPPTELSFPNDVLPVLSHAGCNAGACHAKPAGQAGFKLSVFAYDPKADYRAIVKDVHGRRVFPAAPEESLILKKPTMALEHGGGLRFKKDSEPYRMLVKWIQEGMPYAREGEAELVGIEVYPTERRYHKRASQPLLIQAHYSDGSVRDVTELAEMSSTEKAIARVDERGVVAIGEMSGEAAVIARYMGHVAVSRVTVPAEHLLPHSVYTALPANNFIDQHIYDRLERLGILPSDLCGDAEFLRRASLDAIGVLPTPQRAKAFLADTDPRKREKLIDELLANPAYGDHWGSKWADLLRPNPFRAGVKSVYVLDQWLRESFRDNKPYDQFVREILVAQGSTHKYGPTVIFRDRREPQDISTLVSQIFMGVRMECAKCHHHPNEKWSQEDFYQFAAFFGQIKRKGQGISAPISGEAEYIWFAPGGEVKHPLTGQVMKPKAPDAPMEAIAEDRDPREALADWLTTPKNPFFARAAANRIWAEMMGRGIVQPVDDFRISNPPSNDALLDALGRDFAEHGFDVKHLIRTIMLSRAYQASSIPNPQNIADTRNFSRSYRRRPSAEVLLDAVCDVTGVRESLQGLPAGSRAIQAWNYRIDSDFLDAFARPNLNADPPCERDKDASVLQALHLMNSTKLMEKITSPAGRAAELTGSKRTPGEIVTELFLTTYSRYPNEEELRIATSPFSAPGATRKSATEDIMWALINSAEFVFNH